MTVHDSEQSSYKDGLYAEQWMAAQCGITDVQSHPAGALAAISRGAHRSQRPMPARREIAG